MPYDVRSGFSTLRYSTPSTLHLHVVARDADLRRDIERHLLQRVLVADDVDERHQDVEAGVERTRIAARAARR